MLRSAAKFVPELRQYIGKMPNPVMHDSGFYTKNAREFAAHRPVGH